MVLNPIRLEFSVNYLFDEKNAEAVEEISVWKPEISPLNCYI